MGGIWRRPLTCSEWAKNQSFFFPLVNQAPTFDDQPPSSLRIYEAQSAMHGHLRFLRHSSKSLGFQYLYLGLGFSPVLPLFNLSSSPSAIYAYPSYHRPGSISFPQSLYSTPSHFFHFFFTYHTTHILSFPSPLYLPTASTLLSSPSPHPTPLTPATLPTPSPTPSFSSTPPSVLRSTLTQLLPFFGVEQ
jgi:hypothetical protein